MKLSTYLSVLSFAFFSLQIGADESFDEENLVTDSHVLDLLYDFVELSLTDPPASIQMDATWMGKEAYASCDTCTFYRDKSGNRLFLKLDDSSLYGFAHFNGNNYIYRTGSWSQLNLPPLALDDESLEILSQNHTTVNGIEVDVKQVVQQQDFSFLAYIDGQEFEYTDPIEIPSLNNIHNLTTGDIFTSEQQQKLIKTGESITAAYHNNEAINIYVDIVVSAKVLLEYQSKYENHAEDILHADINIAIEDMKLRLKQSNLEEYITVSLGSVTTFHEHGHYVTSKAVNNYEKGLHISIGYMTREDYPVVRYGTSLDGIAGRAFRDSDFEATSPDNRGVAWRTTTRGLGLLTDFAPFYEFLDVYLIYPYMPTLVLSHEIGHYLGLNHSRHHSKEPHRDFHFNYGYYDFEQNISSTMASMGGFDSGTFSSPDFLTPPLGVRPHDINGADSVTYLKLSTPVNALPWKIQSNRFDMWYEGDLAYISWEKTLKSNVTSLIVKNFGNNIPEIYESTGQGFIIPIPEGVTEIAFDKSLINLPTIENRLSFMLVEGFTDEYGIQPLITHVDLNYISPPIEASTKQAVLISNPRVAKSGDSVELKFSLSEESIEDIKNHLVYSEEPIQIKTEVNVNHAAPEKYFSEPIGVVYSTLEEVIETRELLIKLQMPDRLLWDAVHEQTRYHNINGNIYFPEVRFDIMPFHMSFGTGKVSLDIDSFIHNLSIKAESAIHYYNPLHSSETSISFDIKRYRGYAAYKVEEGFVHSGDSANAIINVSESTLSEEASTVEIELNTALLDGEPYFVTLRSDDGLLSSDSLILLPIEQNNTLPSYDYDGDGISDIVIRRPEIGQFIVARSSDGAIMRAFFGSLGSDIPLAGDFDGDGTTDLAIRRPSVKQFISRTSSDDSINRIFFGSQDEDIPVIADYDGDGIDDIAIRRPSSGQWFIKYSTTGDIMRETFGTSASDIPAVADYDGDGKADIAVRRQDAGQFIIKYSSTGEIDRIFFGSQSTDIAVPADYDGDGKADLAIRRPDSGFWFIKRSTDGVIERTFFGSLSDDIPVVADYDGDGKADIAIRRPASGTWIVKQSSDGSYTRLFFGSQTTDIPLAAPLDTVLGMTNNASASSATESLAGFEIDRTIELKREKLEATNSWFSDEVEQIE